MRKKILLCFIVISIFLLLYYKNGFKNSNSQIDSESAAEKAVISKIETCSRDDDYTGCLKKSVSELLKNYKVSDVIASFDKNENDPDFFAYCHTTLHFLGREIYSKTHNTKRALSQCTHACFQGCIHGVLEGHLQDKGVSYDDDVALRNEIIKICGKKQNYEKKELYNECLHGLGHALMFVSDSNLPRSLNLCDVFETRDDAGWCYSGVFMENSTSSTNKDHPSKYLKEDDPMYPCNILEDKYLEMCYTLQGFYFAKLSGNDVQKTISLCIKVPHAYKPNCFNAVGQVSIGNTQDLDEIKRECYQVEEKEYREKCIQGAVAAMSTRYSGDSNLLIKFCTILEEEYKSMCYQTMKNYLAGWTNSKELNSVCHKIPEEKFKNECLES